MNYREFVTFNDKKYINIAAIGKIKKELKKKAPKFSNGEVAMDAYWVVTLKELYDIIDNVTGEVNKDEYT